MVRAGCGAAGRSAVAPFVRPSRVWLRSCYPPRMRLSPLLRTLAFCILAACGESPSLPAADAATSDSAADLCLSQCELAAGRCEERPLSAFGNLEATRTEWLTRCPANPTQRPFVLEGRCGDGTLLLHQGGNYTSERRYFSSDGAFRSLSTGTDVSRDPCRGRGYWPVRPECEEAEVTKVLCGSSPWGVGEMLSVP